MLHSFLDYLRTFRSQPEPLIEVKIYRDRLLNNLKILRRVNKGFNISPVLKANAYGHGLVEVARILDKEGVPFFVVDSYYEARVLRVKGVKTSILVAGYTPEAVISHNRLKNIAFAITSLSQLEGLSNQKLYEPIPIHVKVDTGMNRQGLRPEELNRANKIIKDNINIIPQGCMSHLADADGWYELPTQKQLSLWNDIQAKWKKTFPETIYYHIRSTSGRKYNNSIQGTTGNVLRIGLGIYGLDETEEEEGIEAVLAIESVISAIKSLSAGDFVGYNFTFESKSDMRVAVVPMGYYEGIDRRLSNKGAYKVGNQYCPILGRVSMNITTVDVSELREVSRGDKIITISPNREDKNSIKNIAKICGTIPYDIVVKIPTSLRRSII